MGVVGQSSVLNWTVKSQQLGAKNRVTVRAGGAYFLVTDVAAAGPACQATVQMHAISDLWKGHFQSISDAAAGQQPRCLLTGRPF